MASLSLKNVCKVYPNGFEAVKDFNLDVADKEFIIFVGPSGCGKSTTLRMIAGLEEISDGTLKIDDKVVNDVEPKDRDIAMVFQNYALYPHMTVYDNIAFGLDVKKWKKADIRRRVDELVELVGLKGFEKRYPNQLSGGQRQRVAFARALAPNPELLLLDEPFAAIDAKVRQELRSWLREMITRVGITSIFVTHDQDEAIEVADEIIITNHGHIEQAGTPIEIYSQPKTPFVTEFMGSPTRISNITSFHGYEELGEGLHAVVRPEHVSVTKKTEQSRFSSSVEEGVVERVMFRGREVELHVRVHDVLLVANRRLEEASITEGERVNVFIYQVFAFPAGENGTQNVNIVENANIETEKLFYI